MTDDEYMQAEIKAQEAMNELKEACDEMGMDFDDRAQDIIYNAEHQ